MKSKPKRSNYLQADGALLAARYAFMPNKLRYCGGDFGSELFEYAARNQDDLGLREMLKEFQTMYPYLRLIAEANRIADPFNYKVVEAYWLGNELLENVSMQNFYRYLVDEQKLKKKFKPSALEKVFGKIPLGAKPHHSWHVLSMPKRTGHYPVEHSLKTIDECRITWGKIKDLNLEDSNFDSGFSKKILVEYQPIVPVKDQLTLGPAVTKYVWSEINHQAFIKEPKVGDWVALHWGWVCDFLTETQVNNLEKWTKYNLAISNL